MQTRQPEVFVIQGLLCVPSSRNVRLCHCETRNTAAQNQDRSSADFPAYEPPFAPSQTPQTKTQKRL